MNNFCYDLLKNRLSKKDKEYKKKQVYNYLLREVGNPNFDKLTSNIVKKTFKVIDKVYFNNNISKRINDTGSKLTFKVSGKLTSTAGRCDYKYYLNEYNEFEYGNFEIKISKPIIQRIFTNEENSLKINGLHCYNRLECYINLYEHEIIHLLIALFC